MIDGHRISEEEKMQNLRALAKNIALRQRTEERRNLLNVLRARLRKPQTYLEMLNDHGKKTGYYLPINNDTGKILMEDFFSTDDPVLKEELARLMIDNHTMSKA